MAPRRAQESGAAVSFHATLPETYLCESDAAAGGTRHLRAASARPRQYSIDRGYLLANGYRLGIKRRWIGSTRSHRARVIGKLVATAAVMRENASNSLNVWSRRLESNQRPAVYELLAKTHNRQKSRMNRADGVDRNGHIRSAVRNYATPAQPELDEATPVPEKPLLT